jgi:hypothetical protein
MTSRSSPRASAVAVTTIGALSLCLAPVACKQDSPPPAATKAPPATLTSAAAPIETAKPAPPASVAAAARTQPKVATKTGKAKAHELSIWDPQEAVEDLVTCGDRDIAVVLPLFLDAPMWKVVADKELGAPKTDIRKGWRGPNSDSVAFRWSGLDTPAGAYVATFTSGKDKVKVGIRIDPRRECED